MLVCYFGCWISIENLLLMAANLLSSVFSLTLVTNPIMQGILRRSNDRTHEQCPLLSGSENGKRGRSVLALLFFRLLHAPKNIFFSSVLQIKILILLEHLARKHKDLTEYLNQDIPMTPTMTPPMTAPSPSSTNSVEVKHLLAAQ